jgi:putative ABC transport system permease protein
VNRVLGGLRTAARNLMRAPAFAVAAVATLGLAIGANAGIFSVVQGVLLRPLPYPEPDRLVALQHTAPGLGYDRFGMSSGLYLRYGGADAFASTGLYAAATVNLTGDDMPPARVAGLRVSRELFTTLGVQPVLGRVFDADEDRPGGRAVVVLAHGLWRERFAADPAAIGRDLMIDGEPRTVIGVMPAGFDFPDGQPRLYLPLALDTATANVGNFSVDAVARLRADADPARAAAAMRLALEQLAGDAEVAAFIAFAERARLAPVVTPLHQRIIGDEVSRALWILLGTVGFVFLIACANVTNLFLVRAESRQKEMAVRAALGAGRPGLVGHYLAESTVLAALGGVLGLGLAWVGLRGLLRFAPPTLPRLHAVTIDPAVLVFTILITAVAALLLALVPAVRLTSPSLLGILTRTARGSTAGRERNRTRQALVVAQTALALVLLAGSGLMVRSFQHLRALDPGFDARDGLTFRLSLPDAEYTIDRALAFNGQLIDRLRELPGVRAAGATSHPPLASCCTGTAHLVQDGPLAGQQPPPIFWHSAVWDGYFEAMGIPLLEGRTFDTADRDPARRFVVVSQAMARRAWPDGGALGRRLRLAAADTAAWYEVVGVVGDVRARGLELGVDDMVYFPAAAAAVRGPTGTQLLSARDMTFVLRTSRPDAVAPLARQEVWSLDASLPVAASATLERIVADSMVRISFTMLALVVAAAIALFLGAIGLYGVISYIVTQRAGEIGIRMALGARPAEVRRMVVLQGVRLSLLGVGVGLAAALGLTRLMQGLLHGTRAHDPLTFVLVAACLTAVALVASYLPALRASRIDPASSLKTE